MGKKILITGSNGLVGQTLIERLLQEQGMEIYGTSLSDNHISGLPQEHFLKADLAVPGQISGVISEIRPDVIVHCGAMTQVDPCESDPDLCDRVNIDGTREVAKAAEKLGSHFIYLSTDFVFDGEKGPYAEEDTPCPVSTYGWSKLQGEFITLSLRCPAAIIRTILVYGVAPAMNRSNLVLWVRKSLKENQPIRVVNDQFRMPTLANDLADGIAGVITGEKRGIYHLSGPEMVSVYDFAIKTARFFSLDETLISPVSSRTLNQPGRRPRSTGFILDKASEELNYSPKNLDEGLAVVQNLLAKY
jgi:dTDP-4-dehydrorhamnose reductase